jgi:hypothetical protein
MLYALEINTHLNGDSHTTEVCVCVCVKVLIENSVLPPVTPQTVWQFLVGTSHNIATVTVQSCCASACEKDTCFSNVATQYRDCGTTGSGPHERSLNCILLIYSFL